MKLPEFPIGKKEWWTAIGGAVVFCLVGFVFMPGLIQKQPTPLPNILSEEQPVALPTLELEQPLREDPTRQASSGATSHPDAFDCMITANDTIEIGSPILGVIESIFVERSDYVEKGQPVAALESSVEAAAVSVARARADATVDIESNRVSLELGKKRLDRASDLYKGKSLSLDIREEIETEAQLAALGVERAKVNHRLALLQLDQAEATLGRRTFRSPVSGFVVERLMSEGEVVDKETLMTIAQIDPLRIEMILPTHLFGAVSTGDSVEIVPEPPLDQPRVAQVTIVDRVLDGASGTFGVRLLLPNPDHSLPGGLRCQARLLAAAPELANNDPGSTSANSLP